MSSDWIKRELALLDEIESIFRRYEVLKRYVESRPTIPARYAYAALTLVMVVIIVLIGG